MLVLSTENLTPIAEQTTLPTALNTQNDLLMTIIAGSIALIAISISIKCLILDPKANSTMLEKLSSASDKLSTTLDDLSKSMKSMQSSELPKKVSDALDDLSKSMKSMQSSELPKKASDALDELKKFMSNNNNNNNNSDLDQIYKLFSIIKALQEQRKNNPHEDNCYDKNPEFENMGNNSCEDNHSDEILKLANTLMNKFLSENQEKLNALEQKKLDKINKDKQNLENQIKQIMNLQVDFVDTQENSESDKFGEKYNDLSYQVRSKNHKLQELKAMLNTMKETRNAMQNNGNSSKESEGNHKDNNEMTKELNSLHEEIQKLLKEFDKSQEDNIPEQESPSEMPSLPSFTEWRSNMKFKEGTKEEEINYMYMNAIDKLIHSLIQKSEDNTEEARATLANHIMNRLSNINQTYGTIYLQYLDTLGQSPKEIEEILCILKRNLIDILNDGVENNIAMFMKNIEGTIKPISTEPPIMNATSSK